MSFFLLLNTKRVFLRILVNKQLLVAIDFHGIFSILWKSMAARNCLVTIILQNNFFCVQQKKETHTGLEELEGE